MAIQGTISEWHDTKGYGYISVDNQDAQIKFEFFTGIQRLIPF